MKNGVCFPGTYKVPGLFALLLFLQSVLFQVSLTLAAKDSLRVISSHHDEPFSGRQLRPKVPKQSSTEAAAPKEAKNVEAPKIPTKKKASKKNKPEENNLACPLNNNGKTVTICHVANQVFQTITIDKKAATVHLKQHQTDYCGECLGERFIREAVFLDIPPAHGVEEHETYDVEFDVKYLESGIVSLAAVQNLIETVQCSYGTITVKFRNIVDGSALDAMFPVSSLLVVDGILFGISCVLDGDPDPLLESGFLLVEGSRIDATGTIVTINGSPGNFNYMFQEESIIYSSRPGSGRRLESVPKNNATTVHESESPVTMTLSAQTTTKAEITLLSQQWKFWDQYIDFLLEFSFRFDIETQINFSFENSRELMSIKKEIPFIDIPFPNAGFKLPEGMVSVINRFLPSTVQLKPAAGLSAAFPVVLQLTAQLDTTLEFGVSNKITTGEKAVQIGLKGTPSDLTPTFRMTKNDPMQSSGLQVPALDDILDNASSQIKIEMFGGLKPQIKLECIGLAKASVGLYAGANIESAFELLHPLEPIPTEPGLPYEIGCDKCHLAEISASLVAKDPFFEWRTMLDKEPRETKLTNFEDSWDFLTLCLLEAGKTCGDTCCDVSESCSVTSGGKGTCGIEDPDAGSCVVSGHEGKCVELDQISSCEFAVNSPDCATTEKCCISSPLCSVNGVEGECINTSVITCPFAIAASECSSLGGPNIKCCVPRVPCSATMGHQGHCIDTTSPGQFCELPLYSSICAGLGSKYKCCAEDSPHECGYGDFHGECILDTVCAGRQGSIAIPSHCPNYPNDILCCFHDLSDQSCITSTNFPGQCQQGTTCNDDPFLVPVDAEYKSPEFSCSQSESCCVECRKGIDAHTECCADNDCPEVWNGCVEHKCSCVVKWHLGVQCCQDSDCGYEIESCRDHQCSCTTTANGGSAECCNNEDCTGNAAGATCVWNQCACKVDWSRGIQCCSDSDCGYESEQCIQNQCMCSMRVDGPECCADSDCDQQLGEFCRWNECVDTECDAGKVECCTDDQCSTGEECFSNKCHCLPDPANGYCCSQQDCSDGYFCSAQSHECLVCDPQLLSTECCEDSDCGDPLIFRCEDRLCFDRFCDVTRMDVECCEDSQCPGVESKCESTKCILRGNPRFTLSWRGDDDLDLHVVCPGDNHIWYSQPYDFMSGGYLDHDDIPMLENGRGRYAENIKFPMDGTAPSGTYYFWIDVFDQVDDLDPWVVSVYLTQGENDILQKQYNGVGLSAIFTYEK